MDPVAINECRKHLLSFQKSLYRFSSFSKHSTQVVQQVAASSWNVLRDLTTVQKVAALTVSLGGALVILLSHRLRRKRPRLSGSVKSLRAAARIRARKLSMSSRRDSTSQTISQSHDQEHLNFSGYNWSELQKASVVDKEVAEESGVHLVDGTPLTPQQLGLMGMEALETVVGYWEDALSAYQSHQRGSQKLLTTKEEAEFTKLLENILECAYQLQYDSEHLFIHEHSILNRQRHRLQELKRGSRKNSITSSSHAGPVHLSQEKSGFNHHRGFSDSEAESFVSAQDTVADLHDFEDLNDILSEIDGEQGVYIQALRELEKNGIPYRAIRTEFVGCLNDTEYLAKIHCLRIAFSHLMQHNETRTWWVDSGRTIFSELINRARKDPTDFIEVYDDLMEFLSVKSNLDLMYEELQSRNVRLINFYDVVLDYILIDSFEDLESPPSSVTAVMKNGWLTASFKETALNTAIWSVLKAKRRLLKHSHGFKAQFYSLSEILLPILAWGFFGPDEELNCLMIYFKDQVMSFIRDLFNHVQFTTVEEMCKDIMDLAREKVELTRRKLQSDEL